MELSIKFDGKQAGQKLKRNMDKAGQMVREAMKGAASDAATEILFRGAEDISEAGNFGDRWQEALHTDIEETQQAIRVITSMQGGPPVSYWRVFEYGASIHAKNPSGYMWLPFTGGSGTDVWPRAYAGSLFRIESKSGLPMLLDADTKEPKYHGHEEVTIPQKFHLRKIIADVAKELRHYYAERMRR